MGAHDMTPGERKALARRSTEELWDKGNLDVCDEVFAAHCSFHNPSFMTSGMTIDKWVGDRAVEAGRPVLRASGA